MGPGRGWEFHAVVGLEADCTPEDPKFDDVRPLPCPRLQMPGTLFGTSVACLQTGARHKNTNPDVGREIKGKNWEMAKQKG